MKFATSVGYLESIGQQANEYLRFEDPDIGWPLDELWVGSELLDGPAEIEATPLVVVLDASPEDLPWLALHPAGDWICEQLGLTKRPISSDRGGARGWVFLVSRREGPRWGPLPVVSCLAGAGFRGCPLPRWRPVPGLDRGVGQCDRATEGWIVSNLVPECVYIVIGDDRTGSTP